jgi:hypothetical protein
MANVKVKVKELCGQGGRREGLCEVLTVLKKKKVVMVIATVSMLDLMWDCGMELSLDS